MDFSFWYLERLRDNTLFANIILTQKHIFLLLLLTTHSLSMMTSITFLHKKIFKHSRKGRPPGQFEYRAYNDKNLCIIACLKEYFSLWRVVVGLDSKLIITTTQRPHTDTGVSIDAMQIWVI